MLPPSPAPPARRGTLPLLGLLLLPIVAAYSIMARFALDVPLIDDYPTILGFAVRYRALPTSSARLHYIFADQYTEYKLVFIHLFIAAQLALTGHVSFAFTFWLGQLSLLGILAVLYLSHFRQVTDPRRRLLLFAPMLLLLFGLNYGEALDWLAPTIGYLLTILLSLAALYLLAEGAEPSPVVRTTLAAAAALAACSIAANAFFLGPLGLIALWPARPARLLRMALWSSAFVLALVPYFIQYHRELHSGAGSALLIPVFFLNFLGAGSPIPHTALPAGIFVLTIYLAALRTGFVRTHPAATLGVTWLFISAVLAALGRGRTGLAFATVSRYKIYSDLFFLFCYGFLAQRVLSSALAPRTQRRLLAAAIACAALFCLRGDHQGYKILRNRRALIEQAFARYRQDPRRNSPLWFNEPAIDDSLPVRTLAIQSLADLNAARTAGLYNPSGESLSK